ncbi:MAG: DUF1064 domain-containing protein [Clostridia bacterium]|nr:DUF1064 domain-containing protein [Clostridia bacterium]
MLRLPNKYRNTKTIRDGIPFDSKAEADRYTELSLLLRGGAITGLKTQVKYELLPKQDKERAVHYIADFVYEENGKTVVEDVKGCKTKEYILKRKMLLYFHGIKVKEVSNVKKPKQRKQ